MKILAIGDSTENIYTMMKFSKKIDIHLIDFPRKGVDLTTKRDNNVEFFDSLLISKQVKKIQEIKDEYDLCLAMPWSGARIAYLAGINYLMYFVGSDITVPPFVKGAKNEYDQTSIHNYNFLERKFYSDILKTATLCVTTTGQYFNELKKYRNDAERIDSVFVDTDIFNENIKPIDIKKKKFTILSPQRFGLEKGIPTVWKALEKCKSDFELWQTSWFMEETTIENLKQLTGINKTLFENAPKQVKFIPLIKKNELGRYIVAVDAIMGQMRWGGQGGIEREAAYCKKPVINYTDTDFPTIIDGKMIDSPFLPQSNDPKDIAEIIDKIVEDKNFRDELAKKENEYVRKISDPEKVMSDWELLFKKAIKIQPKISRKLTISEKISKKLFFKLEKKYVRKFKKNNIKVWGKENYKNLTN